MPSKLDKVENDDNVNGHEKPFLVSVEGNVGSGKSTMLQFFKSFDDVQLCPEPVPKW